MKGNFIDFVVSDNRDKYPDDGEQGSYYYELYGIPLKIVTWAGGTDEEICAMVEAADRGFIDLSDYWAVGDIRTVQLSAMSATDVGESHDAQKVDLVLMHAGGYQLNEAVPSGRTTCSFIVGQKDSLATGGYMNSGNTNSGSWDYSKRRTWCNSVYKNALPNTLLPIFKQFKTITAQRYNGSTNQESVDYFALPTEAEVFGNNTYSNSFEFSALFQFDWYKTSSNIIKRKGKGGSAGIWWLRSPGSGSPYTFCVVDASGAPGANYSSTLYSLAPFGCI